MEPQYNVYTYYRNTINEIKTIRGVDEWIEQKQEKELKNL